MTKDATSSERARADSDKRLPPRFALLHTAFVPPLSQHHPRKHGGRVIYFVALLEIKDFVSGNGKDSISVVLRSFNPEDRKVLGVLDAQGGTYLQAGVSRKNHS
mgnify:CR=1 FL=1